jgi:hypothetical protein
MKRLALIALVCLPLACSTNRQPKPRSTVTPGRGEIKVTVTPNPVVATNVGGSTYSFPFEVVVKETGGHPVTIDNVTASVYAGGGIPVATETYDATKIQALGFVTAIPAKGEIHYRFDPHKDVPDPSLLNSVYGDVRVEAIDDNGARASATTRITVTKK